MTLTLVTNSSLTIEGRPERDNEKNCPSLPLKKLRSYFVFQSLKASLTNVKFGYYLAVSASGILTSNTFLFFFIVLVFVVTFSTSLQHSIVETKGNLKWKR